MESIHASLKLLKEAQQLEDRQPVSLNEANKTFWITTLQDAHYIELKNYVLGMYGSYGGVPAKFHPKVLELFGNQTADLQNKLKWLTSNPQILLPLLPRQQGCRLIDLPTLEIPKSHQDFDRLILDTDQYTSLDVLYLVEETLYTWFIAWATFLDCNAVILFFNFVAALGTKLSVKMMRHKNGKLWITNKYIISAESNISKGYTNNCVVKWFYSLEDIFPTLGFQTMKDSVQAVIFQRNIFVFVKIGFFSLDNNFCLM